MHTLRLFIQELGASGDGIAMVDGKKIFIPHTLPGEEITARITLNHKDHSKAELLEIHHKNPKRQSPPCPHFSRCGGCSLQHMEEEYYYHFKQEMALAAVRRAGFDEQNVAPLVRIGAHARRRAVFKITSDKGKTQLGYFEAHSHKLVDIKECLLLEREIFNLCAPLKTLGVKHVEEIAVSLSDTGLDLLLIAKKEPDLPTLEALAAFGQKHDIARISWKSPAGIIPIAQGRIVAMKLGNVEVALPVGSFMQASRQGQQAITQEIMEATSKASSIIDLYAGCGAYSFPMVEYAKLDAVEGSKPMVEAINQAANRYGYSHKIKAWQQDLYQTPVTGEELARYQAAVINPPRNGASSQMEEIGRSSIPTVVMVSCNSTTFTRDAKILRDAGYSLQKAVGIDQFYLSSHLEMVGIFVR